MSSNKYEVMDVTAAPLELTRMHARVVLGHRRIELIDPVTRQRSVLISKIELDTLERALGILSDTDSVKQMCDHLSQLVAAAS